MNAYACRRIRICKKTCELLVRTCESIKCTQVLEKVHKHAILFVYGHKNQWLLINCAMYVPYAPLPVNPSYFTEFCQESNNSHDFPVSLMSSDIYRANGPPDNGKSDISISKIAIYKLRILITNIISIMLSTKSSPQCVHYSLKLTTKEYFL